MATIDLKYGHGVVPFEYEEERFSVLAAANDSAPLDDRTINERLDQPIGAEPFEGTISPGETVLIVVPDATRASGSAQVVNLVVRRLIANGTRPHEIAIIFATGIHRQVTNEEKAEILTPFITQRIRTIDHRASGIANLAVVGETRGGISVSLNGALLDSDHVITIGAVSFHYFAGFTGGRKLICPGLASVRTVEATHKLAFDCETLRRREGVGTGLLEGNAVHEAFLEAAKFVKNVFSISTVVNDSGEVVDLFCGGLEAAHRAACDAVAAKETHRIGEKRDLVIVSCGGSPFDINLIQAHKALDTAAKACTAGGRIILLAECSEGIGRTDFLDWFDAESSDALARKLCTGYQVNGQTAWNFLSICERFNVEMLTALDHKILEKLRVKKADLRNLSGTGYILPNGAKVNIIASG
ncbi:MAG TPA: nickel-dependent lactate racemase [Pyrinomonadaceae bacterium]|nr:nickel-dependent lactate racemase [Pyrinomonadaceae bacterium]